MSHLGSVVVALILGASLLCWVAVGAYALCEWLYSADFSRLFRRS